MSRLLYLKGISGMVALVLVESSSFPVVRRSVVVARRERLRRVLVRGELIVLGSNAGVGILSRVELVVLWRPRPRLNTPGLVRVPIGGVVVIVTVILIQENSCYQGGGKPIQINLFT